RRRASRRGRADGGNSHDRAHEGWRRGGHPTLIPDVRQRFRAGRVTCAASAWRTPFYRRVNSAARAKPRRLQPQHWKVFAYANAGVFVDGYILSSIGLALITLGPQFHLNAVTTGWVGAATLLGIFVGAPLFGHLTDRHGRRILMIADLCAFVVV